MSMTKNANGIALTLGVAVITAISLVAMLLLSTLGIPFGAAAEVKKEEPPAPSAEVVAQLKDSPAWATLRASLEAPPSGWNGTANIIDSPQSPYPFSCSTDGVNPVISLSRAFTVDGRPLQVMTTAYTAGLGSKGMADRFAKVRSCAGGDAGISTANLTGIGVEAYQIEVNKAGAASRDIMWRYGDVVVYLIAESTNGNTYNLAKSFNDNLVQKMNGICLANDSSESDWGRTPWGNSTFTGLITDRKVEIEKVGLPAITGATPTPAPTGTAAPSSPASVEPTTAPTFEAHPLEPAKTELPEVSLPDKPTAYPVWPLLPQPVAKPTEPNSPAKEPPFQSSVKEQVEDVKGPGCGWAFTGTVAPLFKAADAKTAADELEKAEKTRLAEESKKWQSDVLQYWKDYDAFKKQVPAWNAYVENVNTVAAAWDAISRKWATYNANKEIWDRLTEERKTFLDRQKAASESYTKAIEQCKIQDEADEKKAEEDKKKAEEEAKKKAESPKPTASPSPTASASPSPSPTPTEVRLVCPPIKPAIIDQAAPADPGPAPVPPADPRPENQRG